LILRGAKFLQGTYSQWRRRRRRRGSRRGSSSSSSSSGIRRK
jgi:hypothetical protein